MKTQQRTALSLGLSAILVLAGTVTSATATTTNPQVTASPTAAENTGEEVFRAVIFGQGDLAEELGDLSPTMEQTVEVRTIADNIVDSISASSPAFFDEFGTMTQSGKVSAVDRAFSNLAPVLAEAVVDLGYADASDPDLASPRWAAITVVLFAAVGVVYAYAAILQIQAVATSTWSPSSQDAGPGTPSLSHEKWIASVTTALD